MVLTQLARRSRRKFARRQFPYHYGSYATGTITSHKYIQFPKFPYHYGSYATSKTDLETPQPTHRFHTTMVLTQRGYGENVESCVCSVSIPLWFLRNQLDQPVALRSRFCVSIPLWFLRNRFYYKDIIQVLGRQNQPIGKIS